MTALDADAAHEYLLEECHDLVTTVFECADAVAASWDGRSTRDRGQVVPPMRATLERAGVHERLPAVLRGCVAAAGGALQARPVAAPPYVAIASVGPVLRASLSEGRLVVTLNAFAIERDPVRYVRDSRPPTEAVTVEVRER